MYTLTLGNSQRWLLTAEDGQHQWLQKFASILCLTSSGTKTHPKLIFTCRNMRNEDGWEGQALSALQFWSHPKTEDIICEIQQDAGKEPEIMRIWHAQQAKKTTCCPCIPPSWNALWDILRMRQSLRPIYHRALVSGGLPLHAALIEKDGQGILLAAAGNTGKTTCYQRIPLSWNALCDDEALIVIDKRKQYRVHPFPTWSDYLWKGSYKTWDVQRCLPLRAIFFLQRGKNDEAIPVGRAEAAVYNTHLAAQALSWSWKGLDDDKTQEIKKTLFSNTCRLATTIPGFMLQCTLHGKFWERIEEVL